MFAPPSYTEDLHPIGQRIFVMFQDAFESNAKNVTSQAMRDGDSFRIVTWADNGWASSRVFGLHSITTVTFSKWVNIDNRHYQI